jgi:hypothetical protein
MDLELSNDKISNFIEKEKKIIFYREIINL